MVLRKQLAVVTRNTAFYAPVNKYVIDFREKNAENFVS
jgi:hypothetical protein